MKPYIQIWDLDLNTSHQMIMEVHPCRVLAGHTDSIYGLASNKQYRNLLASASAHKRVKIWNVVVGMCDITMEHHSNKARIKVLAVAWNHHAPQVLLNGSLDRTVVMGAILSISFSEDKPFLLAVGGSRENCEYGTPYLILASPNFPKIPELLQLQMADAQAHSKEAHTRSLADAQAHCAQQNLYSFRLLGDTS